MITGFVAHINLWVPADRGEMGSPWLLGNRVSSWVSHAPLPSPGSWWILYMRGSCQEPPHSGRRGHQILFPLESTPKWVHSMQAMPMNRAQPWIKDTKDQKLEKSPRRTQWIVSIRKQSQSLICPRLAANCHTLKGDRLLKCMRTGNCCLSLKWSYFHIFTPINSPPSMYGTRETF